jgi:hypothetical protein
MTAKQLIALLQQLPPDTQMVVRGYEDGYNDISQLKHRNVQPHEGRAHDWNGGYQDAATTESATFAVELFGENNEAVSSNR